MRLMRAHHSRQVIIRPDGMRVVECTTCGIAYLNPMPKAPIALFYDYAGREDQHNLIILRQDSGRVARN